MREIKFRAWLTPHDQNIGKMVQVNSILGGLTNPERIFDEDGEKFKNDYGGIVLMQYTGLKDKNGKEIYEGDIILGDAVVVWRNEPEYDRDHCCFGITNGKYTLGSYVDRDDFVIIGNIYENPELLNYDKS